MFRFKPSFRQIHRNLCFKASFNVTPHPIKSQHTNFHNTSAVNGKIYTQIELRNYIDVALAKKGTIKPNEIRSLAKPINTLVDTRFSQELIVHEDVVNQLGLTQMEEQVAETDTTGKLVKKRVPKYYDVKLGDDTVQRCPVFGIAEMTIMGRIHVGEVLVVPRRSPSSTALLGVIPLEKLDINVNPAKHTLELAHPDRIMATLE